MNDNLHSQIRASLTRKGTDELVEIWRRHNLDEWTELTFDIIREILQKRQVELPPQEKQGRSKIGAGIDKSPDIRELEGKIKESEVLLAEANRTRFSGCLPLLISLGVMLTMAVKIPGGDIYVIMTMAGMLYFGFNLWRLLLQRKVAVFSHVLTRKYRQAGRFGFDFARKSGSSCLTLRCNTIQCS